MTECVHYTIEITKTTWQKRNLYNVRLPNETCKNRNRPVTIAAYVRLVTRETLSPSTTVITHFDTGGLPPAQLKQVQFVLNIKHAFFDAMS